MAFLLKKKESSKKLVGLKIGYHSCRLVELAQDKKGFSLTNYGEIVFPLFTPPEPVGLEGLETPRYSPSIDQYPPPEIMAQNLAYLFEMTKISEKNIYLSIPSFLFFISTLEIPSLPPEKIPGCIREEVKRYYPFPLEESVIDWQLIDSKISFLTFQKKSSHVLTYLILKKTLDYFEKISQILKVHFLPTPDFFSLLRLIAFEEKLLNLEPNNIYGLFYVDDEYALFMLFRNNLPLFVWPIELSMFSGLEKLSESLGINFQMAEEIRKKVGITNEASAEIKNALLSLFENLMIEVQKRVKDFEQKKMGLIEEVFLTGPGIMTAGFVDSFQFFVEKKGKILPFPKSINVLANLEPLLPEIISYFALPLGSLKALEKM